MKSIATTEIAASPARVREVFLDFAQYPAWSKGPIKTVKPVSKDKHTVETGDTLEVHFDGMGTLHPLVLENSTQQFRWRGNFRFLGEAEHTFRFEESKSTPGWTTFINSEVFSGPAVKLVSPLTKLMGADREKSSPGFEKFNKTFKERVESLN